MVRWIRRSWVSVLMHEHVFVLTPEMMENYPKGWDEETRVADAIARLKELKASGIDTIVDLTVLGPRPLHPSDPASIAEQADLNIIVATGLYTYNDVPHYFHFRGPGTVVRRARDPWSRCSCATSARASRDTGVKAGILKCATDEPGVTPGVERVLRAVAQAHRATGAPITPTPSRDAAAAWSSSDIFERGGRRPDTGGHRPQRRHHRPRLSRGAHRQRLVPRHGPLRHRRAPADRGPRRHDRDAVRAGLRRPDGAVPRRVVLHRLVPPGDLPSTMPNWHYLHITRRRHPRPARRGVTEEQIDHDDGRQPAPHISSARGRNTRDGRNEDFRALGARLRNWGRWGADDERGTVNLSRPSSSSPPAALVKHGQGLRPRHPVRRATGRSPAAAASTRCT